MLIQGQDAATRRKAVRPVSGNLEEQVTGSRFDSLPRYQRMAELFSRKNALLGRGQSGLTELPLQLDELSQFIYVALVPHR